MDVSDPFNLHRFIDAQISTYDEALKEIRAGLKRSHWMWFIFPQLKRLGRSPMAEHYGLASLQEARAYLAHPLLGPRLLEITTAAINAPAASLYAVFGAPDDMKFKSSMTLFERAADETQGVFGQALDQWCDGQRDNATLDLLAG